MIHLYHSTSQISREVFLSDEIKSGYGKCPNWLFNLVENEKITPEEAFLWVRINNVPPGFKYRRAALLNLKYPRRLIDHGIKKLIDLNLIIETKENIRNVHYEAIDLQKDWYKMNQSLVQNEPIVGTKRTTNKTISKNINNGENSPEKITHPTSYRRSININHLFVPGKRRDRLEDSAYRLLGGFLPEFWEWLESTSMSNKATLPLRLNQKIHQSTLQAALTFLDQRAQDKII